MVRKQLYIGDDQERRLKRRARRLGVSEAEFVRRALEAALVDDSSSLPVPDRAESAEGLLAAIERLAKRSSFPRDWKFSRDDVYSEREDRLSRG